MEQCAVVLNGNDVVKISNLKRKYDKIMNNPSMKILEECKVEELDEKYEYWKYTISIGEIEESVVKLYHYKNYKTGNSISSIYPDIENLKPWNKDWMDYVKLN